MVVGSPWYLGDRICDLIHKKGQQGAREEGGVFFSQCCNVNTLTVIFNFLVFLNLLALSTRSPIPPFNQPNFSLTSKANMNTISAREHDEVEDEAFYELLRVSLVRFLEAAREEGEQTAARQPQGKMSQLKNNQCLKILESKSLISRVRKDDARLQSVLDRMVMPAYINAEEMENADFSWIETENFADLLEDFPLPLYSEAPPPPSCSLLLLSSPNAQNSLGMLPPFGENIDY